MGPVGSGKPVPSSNGRHRQALPLRALGWIETVFIAAGAVTILAMCVYITLGILLRSLAGTQIPDEVVIVGDLMIGALILPLAFVAADRGFIAVEVLTDMLPKSTHVWLNVLAAAIGLTAVIPITYAGYLAMVHAIESGNYFFGILEVPEWPGRVAFFAGYALFFIRLTYLFVHDLLRALLSTGKDHPDEASDPSGKE
ncbi:TRAP transporter small permease [Roseibium sp. RKSG952]|uniref:TRAP transporter small permease n=1 Tax=Roseibium sp. RKSG952 TaxID=2529384 RepID=UPI0012BD2710|nr:TRAP transporter small permease [Roseibium sp. RKSG952]MTH96192.1 TRAP transporter small permease [Roseibium sp. RKSG952]